MLLGNFGDAVHTGVPAMGSPNGRFLELSLTRTVRLLGTSELRYGASAAVGWERPSGRLRINEAIVGRQSAYLRLFTSYASGHDLNGIVAGFGARWIGVSGNLKNGYVELGTGIALIDGLSIDVNSHFNFASFVGGGFYFGEAPAASRLGVRWMHISNAGINPPNRGINQIEVVFGIRL